MRKSLLLLAIMVASGCTWNDYISPEGKSVAEVRQDLWQCEREAGMASSQFFFVHLQELQDHCMEARGYQAATN
jgi:hypothetical protein